jgi:drug/metabolite transporter (DMT)-like permease
MLGGMSRRTGVEFAFVAAFWGASYLFIKVALDDVFSPPMIVFVRTALAAVVLAPLAWRTGRVGALRGAALPIVLLAVIQVVAPFMLISFGEDHISSSLAGILVSTAPIYAFLLAVVITPEERAKRIGAVGVAVGIAGVVLLLGVDAGGGTAALLGGAMVALAGLGYAAGSFLIKRRIPGQAPIVLVTATMATSAVLSLPFAAFAWPTATPSLDAVASLTALGVLGTGIAFVFYYDLIDSLGPPKASLVAYVAPGFAVLYGVVLLGEDVSVATFAGLLLILLGSYLAAYERLPFVRPSPPADHKPRRYRAPA